LTKESVQQSNNTLYGKKSDSGQQYYYKHEGSAASMGVRVKGSSPL